MKKKETVEVAGWDNFSVEKIFNAKGQRLLNPEITFITPVSEGTVDYLKDSHESILYLVKKGYAQHFVVGDGIPSEVCRAKAPFATKIFSFKNKTGASAARNFALSRTHTPWVAPLDADDVIFAEGFLSNFEHVSRGTNNYNSPKFSWVAGEHFRLTSTRRMNSEEGQVIRDSSGEGARVEVGDDSFAVVGKVVPLRHVPLKKRKRFKAGELLPLWGRPHGIYWHPNNIIVETELALRVGGWPAVGGAEDRGFLLKIAATAPGIATGTFSTLYREHPGQVTKTNEYEKNRLLWRETVTTLVNAYAESVNAPKLQGLA